MNHELKKYILDLNFLVAGVQSKQSRTDKKLNLNAHLMFS